MKINGVTIMDVDNNDLTKRKIQESKKDDEANYTFHIIRTTFPKDTSILETGSCSGLKVSTVFIPKHIKEIRESSFDNCKLLSEVVFDSDSKVKVIQNYLFRDCISLSTIVLPKTIERIMPFSFNRCKKLKEIIIPTNARIWNNAFADCINLQSVKFESDKYLDTIKFNCFEGCNKLTDIIIKNQEYKIPKGFFKNRYQRNPDISLMEILKLTS